MLTINVETAGDYPVRKILLVNENNIQSVGLTAYPWGCQLQFSYYGGGGELLDGLEQESALRLFAALEKAISPILQ